MVNVLITGGTGLIGKHLSEKLKENGYETAILSRNRTSDKQSGVYYWDYERMIIDEEALIKADYIVHLAGTNIGDKRWSEKRKSDILNSRIKTGELLLEKIKKNNLKPKAFISASATGFYGSVTSEKIFTEIDNASDDFPGTVCKKWEESADKFSNEGIRTVKIRTGIVLAGDGGALSKMKTPILMGLGSIIGNGRQYMPWIHIDDLCNIYIKAIEDEKMDGTYNAVAPDHVTNRYFTGLLASTLKKPLWLPPIPAFFMKLFFGEMSEILLYGSRVSSEKILQSGFGFRFPDLRSALADLTT